MGSLDKYKTENKDAPSINRFQEASGDPILHVDGNGILLYINPAAQSLLSEWQPTVGNSLPEAFLKSLNQCLASDACSTRGVEVRVEERQIVFTPVPFNDSDFLFLHGHDVTWWRHYNAHLKLLANVYQNVSESIIITDTNGIIEAVNPAFTTINGYAADEVIGRTPRFLQSGRHDADFYKSMWNDIKKRGRWQGKVWNRRKNGEIYPALLSIAAIANEEGETTHYCSLCYDMMSKKEETEALWIDAFRDPLTGLPTMQLFYDRLEQAFSHTDRDLSMIAILVVNLDEFRRFNETLGYRQGDLLLQQTARRLKGVCRQSDTLTRFAADSFIMLTRVVGNPRQALAERAQRILKSFSVPVELGGTPVQVSARIGISVYPTTAKDMYTLLEQAQVAAEQAKARGGNQYRIYK
ncbi:sensor domain-containing diguanylate cyclase [Desulfosarcina ovata]|uniref:Diguanylate cyclase n=1 Tax=Desulfosarcina ovata subsp. ovata TaxID=2752305 RepID=A0A5K8AH19_9BACT|nr:sensor domain-containing diguanylate cyclase [Desulfosarcina ovata]BBO91858.1 hypothetical protein DSCOOX_50380 [Desulfosarcina ovata subsp. ovata]